MSDKSDSNNVKNSQSKLRSDRWRKRWEKDEFTPVRKISSNKGYPFISAPKSLLESLGLSLNANVFVEFTEVNPMLREVTLKFGSHTPVTKLSSSHGYPIYAIPKIILEALGLSLNAEFFMEYNEVNPLLGEVKVKFLSPDQLVKGNGKGKSQDNPS